MRKFNMIEPFGNKVIATDIEYGEQMSRQGIIIPDDNGKERGIHPRWCKVYKVGEEVNDVKEGEWILVEHGRWSYKFVEKDDEGVDRDFWYIDHNCILAVDDDAA